MKTKRTNCFTRQNYLFLNRQSKPLSSRPAGLHLRLLPRDHGQNSFLNPKFKRFIIRRRLWSIALVNLFSCRMMHLFNKAKRQLLSFIIRDSPAFRIAIVVVQQVQIVQIVIIQRGNTVVDSPLLML